MRAPRRKSAALPFAIALPKFADERRGFENMPKKKKAAKKKH